MGFSLQYIQGQKGQRPDGLWHCSSMVYVFRVKIMMSSLSDVEFLFTSSPNPLVPSSTSSARSSASISSPSQILILAPLRCCSPLQSPPYMKDKYLMALVKSLTPNIAKENVVPSIYLWRDKAPLADSPVNYLHWQLVIFSSLLLQLVLDDCLVAVVDHIVLLSQFLLDWQLPARPQHHVLVGITS